MFRPKQAEGERLPQTKAAQIQAIKRAHFQCIVWNFQCIDWYNDTVA